MSRTYRGLIFLMLMLFTYMGSFFAFGRWYVDGGRWVPLGVLCLYAMNPPKPLPGSFAGGAVKLAGLFFASFALISSVWSSQKSFYTFARGVSVVLLAVFLFYSLWPRLRRVADYCGLVSILYRAAWIMVLACAFLYVAARGSAVRPYTGAFQGLFGNPNMLGMVFAVLTPVCVARFFVKKTPFSAALPFVTVVMILMSQSRAGLVGAFFGTAAFLACYYGRRVWIVAGVMLLVMLPYTAIQQGPSMFDQAEQDFMRGETSISEFGSGRYGLWMFAFERFKNRPFTGYGFGTGGDVYLPSGEPFRYHSSFSQIAVELGVVGLMYFAMPMMYAGFLVAKYHFVSVGNAHARAAIGGLMGGWLGGAMNSFFESWLFSVGNIAALLAWMCFAAGVKAISEAKTLGLEAVNEKR